MMMMGVRQHFNASYYIIISTRNVFIYFFNSNSLGYEILNIYVSRLEWILIFYTKIQKGLYARNSIRSFRHFANRRQS